jgi:peptidoglycan-associated lipoprotein
MKHTRIAAILIAICILFVAAGCKKKVPPPPPPPPPKVEQPPPPKPPAAVINSFTAEPSSIIRGEASTLRWSVSNATRVVIDNGIGEVQSSGNRQVYPTANTTYRLTASSPGGDAVASVTVNVSAPPPPPPPPPKPAPSISERMAREVQDIFFDYDKSEIREDARATLHRNADALKSILNDFPAAVISLEGHCDERGSAEYNLGLGDRRASAAREFLIQVGVPADRLKPISYGKERPVCTESNEDCWQKNRRVHFTAAQ